MSIKKDRKIMRSLKYILPLCLLFATGCNQEDMGGETEPKEILLGIDGVSSGAKAVTTRAAIDKWDETVVSIAYAFGSPVLFDKALTVTIADDQVKHINTGMEYPADGNTASFVGYHPAKTPNEQGIVGYDLSAGDQDVMLSNMLSGVQSAPISNTMKFEHKLTRFTFIMKCLPNQSYPETVHGVRAIASTAEKLMTYINVNLNNGNLNFSFPGQVTSSIPEGAVVPQSSATDYALAFDLMLQPQVPVGFEIITLTDVKQFSASPELVTLLGIGGEAGKQYTIRLWFSGEGIIADGISITPWTDVVTAASGGTWW
jgi:hypothetical protein